MKYESSVSFCKNASVINEAYEKIYSKKNFREINESDEDTSADDIGFESEDIDKKIKNFNPDKEYEDYMRSERNRIEREREESNDQVASGESDKDEISGIDKDEDDDTKSFMSSFNSRGDAGSSFGGGDDFIFSTSRYGNVGRNKYPDWMREAARKAGKTLPDDEVVSTYGGHGAKSISVQSNSQKKPVDSDDGNPWDNLYENIVVAHPEVFNDERYDMDELKKHKKEFMKLWDKYFDKGFDEIRSAEKAFEDIPGCECKVDSVDIQYDDIVGDIDSEDYVDGVKSEFDDMDGYGIVVKSYEKDFSPETMNKRYTIRYITPDEFKGRDFENLEDAKNSLRDFMVGLIGDPDDVCIGVIVDNKIAKRIFNGDSEEVMTDDDGNVVYWTSGPSKGKPKKRKIKSTVYTISSSDKENTDRCISYETSDWTNKPEPCDEYLQ